MSKGTLIDMYRRKGHWQAEFGPPSVAVDPACGGVAATLPVSEGAQFAWDRAEWSGIAAIPAADLDKAMGIKPGDVADVSRIDAGVRQVQALYRKQGYMLAAARYTPKLDAAARRAVFEIRIEEGPQFRMGALRFAGVNQADAAALTKKWRLAEGSVYDDTYPVEYYRQVLATLRGAGGTPAETEIQVDTERRVVNVRFTFR